MVHGKVDRGPWSFVSKRPAKVRHAPSDCLPPDAMECLLRHRGDDLRVVRALAGVDGEDAEESKLLLERRGGTGSGSLGGRGSLGGLFDSLIQEDREGSHDVEDGEIPAIGGPEPADGGSTGPAIGGPEPADGGSARRPLPRLFSDPDSPPELPAAKRRRLVVDTLVTLRERIKVAAVANQWTSPSQWNTNNVKHLIQELVQVLQGLLQDTGFDKGTQMTDKVANFIGNIFVDHSSYVHLHQFVDTFRALRDAGVTFTGQHTLLESLAKHPRDSLERWRPTDADVIDRSLFTSSPLFISYTEHVCKLLLDTAKEHIRNNNTQEGLGLLSDALSAASLEKVPSGFRKTAEFATMLFGDSFKTDIELLDFLLPNEEESKKNIGFLMDWAPNRDITQAAQLMLANANLNHMTWKHFQKGITLINRANAVSPNRLVELVIEFISDVTALVECKLEDNDKLEAALGQLIIWRVGLKPENEVMAFDSAAWAEHGFLGNISYHKFGKIVAKFWKTTPKNLINTAPEGILNFLTMLKSLEERQASLAATSGALQAAATGGALPAAAQIQWQELLQECSSNQQLRQSISAAEKSLLRCRDEHGDTTTSTLSTLDLSLDQARKLFGHLMSEGQQTTEDPNSVELPVVAMLEAVQLFIANVQQATADAGGQPAAANAVGQPGAANAVGQPEAANDGLPAAAKILVGDIGTGKAMKLKDKFHAQKCEVLGLLSTHVKVKMLEGEAKGLEHKYLYKDFTVTEPVNREPPEGPPLPPPDMAPVDKCAIVGSTGPASSSTGPASSSTGPASGGPDRAFEVTAAAEVPEAAAVEQPVKTMEDIFNAAFPE